MNIVETRDRVRYILTDLLGTAQMAEVDRVERPTKDADARRHSLICPLP